MIIRPAIRNGADPATWQKQGSCQIGGFDILICNSKYLDYIVQRKECSESGDKFRILANGMTIMTNVGEYWSDGEYEGTLVGFEGFLFS